MANAFEGSHCPIEPVDRVPDEGMLANGSIPGDVPPLGTCEPEQPQPFAPEPPCPTFSVSGGDGVAHPIKFGGTYTDNPPRARLKFTAGSCCDFNIEQGISVPCTVVSPKASSVAGTATYEGSSAVRYRDGPGHFKFGFTRNLPTCEFELQVKSVDVPAITIRPPGGSSLAGVAEIGFASGPTGSLRFGFTRNDDATEFDLAIDDVLAPCPTVGPADWTITAIAGQPVAYRVAQSAGCSYEFELDGSGGSSVSGSGDSGNFGENGRWVLIAGSFSDAILWATPDGAGNYTAYLLLRNTGTTPPSYVVGPEIRVRLVVPGGGETFLKGRAYWATRNGTVTADSAAYALFYSLGADKLLRRTCDDEGNPICDLELLPAPFGIMRSVDCATGEPL